jgi:hypothetical protein
MNRDPDDRDRSEVVDEEGLVDRERKRMILEARRDVREWKGEIYREVKLGELDLEVGNELWGERVREYLLTIEPLLREGELAKSEQVYLEAPIGAVTIDPPEEYVEAAGRPTVDKNPDFRVFGGAPEPKTVPFQGLRSIIENEVAAASWDLNVLRPDSPGGGRKPAPSPPTADGGGSTGGKLQNSASPNETITETRPIPKPILQDAVRIAESWLQSVDLGIEVGNGRPFHDLGEE